DAGATWVRVNLPTNPMVGPGIFTLAIDPQNPRTMYAGAVSGVFKTADGGTSWSAINSGLPIGGLPGVTHRVTFLVIEPQDPGAVYAGCEEAGTFKTTDGGASWNAVTGLPAYIIALAVDSRTNTVYAGTSIGAFKSMDQGTRWTAISSGLVATHVSAIAILAQNSRPLFAIADGRV